MSAMLVNCGVLLEFTEKLALQVELPLPISDPTQKRLKGSSKVPCLGIAEPLIQQKKRTAKQPKSEKRVGGKPFPTDVGCYCLSHDMTPAPAESPGKLNLRGQRGCSSKRNLGGLLQFPRCLLLGVVSDLVMLALSVVYFVVYLGEASPKKTQCLRLTPSRTPATDRQLSQSFRGH